MRYLWILALASCAPGACLPMEEVAQHIGKNACVHVKVLSVSATPGGTHLLHFCAEKQECGFSAVVFRRDLRHVGDVRALEGKEVDIEGKIHLYQGR